MYNLVRGVKRIGHLTFVQNRVKIFHVSQDLIRQGRVLSHRQHFFPQPAIDVGKPSKIPKDVADEDGGGVVVGYEQEQHFRPQTVSIFGNSANHGPQQVAPLGLPLKLDAKRRLFRALTVLVTFGSLLVGPVDLAINKLMDDFDRVMPELPFEHPQPFAHLQA